MNEKILTGFIVNSIGLIHLLIWNRLAPKVKFIAFLMLLIPYFGFILYYIFFMMDYPPPKPKWMQQGGGYNFGWPSSNCESRDETFPPLPARAQNNNETIPRKLHIIYRIAGALIGVILVMLGIASIKAGSWYFPWYRGIVFGPASIIIGGVVIYLCLIKPYE